MTPPSTSRRPLPTTGAIPAQAAQGGRGEHMWPGGGPGGGPGGRRAGLAAPALWSSGWPGQDPGLFTPAQASVCGPPRKKGPRADPHRGTARTEFSAGKVNSEPCWREAARLPTGARESPSSQDAGPCGLLATCQPPTTHAHPASAALSPPGPQVAAACRPLTCALLKLPLSIPPSRPCPRQDIVQGHLPLPLQGVGAEQGPFLFLFVPEPLVEGHMALAYSHRPLRCSGGCLEPLATPAPPTDPASGTFL